MVQVTRKTDGAEQHRVSELDPIFVSGRGQKLVLCEGELAGLLDILAHPETPTDELRKAWAEYNAFAAENPDAGW